MIVSHEEAKQLISQSHIVVHVQHGYCVFPQQDHPYQQTPFDVPTECICEVKKHTTGQILLLKEQDRLIASFITFNS